MIFDAALGSGLRKWTLWVLDQALISRLVPVGDHGEDGVGASLNIERAFHPVPTPDLRHHLLTLGSDFVDMFRFGFPF